MSALLTTHFYDSANRYSAKAALKEKVNGTYRSITYQEMKERVEQVAVFLLNSDLESGDRVALLSENRSEWPIIDMGLITAGFVNVPIYPTLTASQIAYILNDSGSKGIVVSSSAQLDKVRALLKDCPSLSFIICLSDCPDDLQLGDVRLIDYKSVLAEGERLMQSKRSELEARRQLTKPSDMVSIVYTSGTTGNPKGVMLSHLNFASNAMAAAEAMGFSYNHVSLSFLPLSHVLERTVHYVMQYCGATIAYAESIDTIGENLQEVQPSAFVAVPRVFEKIYTRIIQNIENEKPLKRKIFYWALDVGKQAAAYKMQGKPLPTALAAKHKIADKLVFGKIKARTGGKIEFAVSGGAPLMKELAEFFFAVGINIYEGYGLTETSPVISFNRPNHVKLGTVGQVLKEFEVKIAEDGEILARGPNIMQGYFNNPEATAEVLSQDGWFHTGDIGEVDSEGYLKITDRKKEILVTSNGKNVAPQPVENTLKTSPYIEQAILVGDNQKYMGALIYPNYEALTKMATEEGIKANSPEEMSKSEHIHAFLRKEIDTLTQDFARYEQIKKFVLLSEEMTQENGCLTPTLKLKRRIISEMYKDQINSLFES
jgi:long-chain acyl-CoA synthetase